MRDIAFHILRKVLIMLALIAACAAYTVAAFAEEGGVGTPPLRGGRVSSEAGHEVQPATSQASRRAENQAAATSEVSPTQSHTASVPSSTLEALRLGKKVVSSAKPSERSEKMIAPSSIGRTVLALGAVLALIGVLAVVASVVRRKAQRSGKWPLLSALNIAGASAPSGVLEILAKFPVGSGTNLLLLKLDRRVLLISQSANKGLRTGSTLSTLCELSEPADVASLLMKVRGEEQSRLAAKFESILAREDEITEQALSEVEEPVRAAGARSARHKLSAARSGEGGASLVVPSDGNREASLGTDHAMRVVGVTRAGGAKGEAVKVGSTWTGGEALREIQARMGADRDAQPRQGGRAGGNDRGRSSLTDGGGLLA